MVQGFKNRGLVLHTPYTSECNRWPGVAQTPRLSFITSEISTLPASSLPFGTLLLLLPTAIILLLLLL